MTSIGNTTPKPVCTIQYCYNINDNLNICNIYSSHQVLCSLPLSFDYAETESVGQIPSPFHGTRINNTSSNAIIEIFQN